MVVIAPAARNLSNPIVLLIGDDEIAVREAPRIGRTKQPGRERIRAVADRSRRLRSRVWASPLARNRSDRAGRVDPPDALIARVGEIDVAFGVHRDVAGLLEPVRVAG